MAMKIRTKDNVIILTGKDKGKIGIVQNISSNKKKVIIKGINYIYKHQKGIPAQNIESSILKKESFIDISNIAILNPETQKSDRVGFRIENGKKIRFFKSNKNKIK